MKATRRHLIALLLPSFLLTGCFDLGQLGGSGSGREAFEKYYDAFYDVKAYTYSASDPYKTWTYNIEDSLFNDETVNSFEWADEEDKVSAQKYLYIIIEPKQAMKIEQIMLYFYSEEKADLSISSFYVESESLMYEKPMFTESPEFDEESQPIDYDDPNLDETAVLSVYDETKTISSKTWSGLMIDSFKQDGHSDRKLHMEADSLFYLRINNNSGYYKTLSPATFSFIDLAIRAV